MGITIRGGRRGAAKARAWKKTQTGSSTARSNVSTSGMSVKQVKAYTDPGMKKGSPFWEAGFDAGFTPIAGKEKETGKVTSADYVKKHAAGFGTTQPQNLREGLTNVYGGTHTVIKDEETGAIVVMDSTKDYASLIEPAGGLSNAERREIVGMVDQTGDVPNIGEVLRETETPMGQSVESGDSFFGGDTYEQSYTEGDLSTSTGGGSGGKLGGGMLLVVGAVLVVLYVLFGRGGK